MITSPHFETANTYLVCPPDGTTRSWRPPFDAAGLPHDCTYFGGVLQGIDEALGNQKLKFVITWSVDQVPMVGSDVVVFCIGDEWSRWPKYAHLVKAVFKTHGFSPKLPLPVRGQGLQAGMAAFLQSGRLVAKVLRRLPTRTMWYATPASRRSTLATIPIGTYQAEDWPWTSWLDRDVDVAFLGSVDHSSHVPTGFRRFISSPKTHSRAAMLRALAELGDRRPDLEIRTGTTGGFAESGRADPAEYSNLMSRTKIALAPRGTNPETFRFFEGHLYGCIVIAEKLPGWAFYRDPNIISLDNWRHLPRLIEDILSEPALAFSLHLQSMKRWSSIYAPDQVASAVVESLRR